MLLVLIGYISGQVLSQKYIFGINTHGTEGFYLKSFDLQLQALIGFESSDLAELQDNENSGIAIYQDSNDANGILGAFDDTDNYVPIKNLSWIDNRVSIKFKEPITLPADNNSAEYAGADFFIVIRTGESVENGGTLNNNDEFRLQIIEDSIVVYPNIPSDYYPYDYNSPGGFSSFTTDSIIADITAPVEPNQELISLTIDEENQMAWLNMENGATEPNAVIKVYMSEEDALSGLNHIAKMIANPFGGLSAGLKVNAIFDKDETGNLYITSTDIAGNEGLPASLEYVLEIGNNALKFTISNQPNPFNPVTNISFSIAEKGWTKISIFNLKGEKINTIFDSEKEAGKYSVQWNGKNSKNQTVSSGVYFYSLEFNGKKIDTGRMLLLK